MAGLDQRDMDVLSNYAKDGNRLLYWNYLAQHPGNDGYGLLALGVVRNDSMPGAVANQFAQMQAIDRRMSERDWEAFGQDLIQQDFALRFAYMHPKDGRAPNPAFALNLPVRDVQKAHDEAFEKARINPNAWTPRELLDAARRHCQEPAAQDVWHTLLDNSGWGSERLLRTMGNIAAYHPPADATAYMFRLGAATGAASQSLPHDDPNRIGAKNQYAQYFPKQDAWYVFDHSASATVGPMASRLVTDTTELQELNDARAVRMERQQKATQFDLQDPYRTLPLKKSPFTIADNGHDLAPATHAAGLSREPGAQRGSIDDLFLRLTDAAVARDDAGMRAVGQAFIASDAGQQWLQAGRDHNQAERDAALAAQQAQALAQQAAALQAAPQQHGPVMRM